MSLKTFLLITLVATTATFQKSNAQIAPETVLYESDFTGANGTTPKDWSSYAKGDNSMEIQSNRYTFRRNTSGSAMFAWYTGDYESGGETPIPASEWENYSVEAVFRSGYTTRESTRNGLILRWQGNTEGLYEGYHGFLTYVDASTIALSILKNFSVGGGSDPNMGGGTLLKSESFTFSLADNVDYRLSFQGAGNELTLTFSTLDNASSYSITISDSSYTIGSPGLRVYQSSNSRTTGFQSVVITSSIPEPSASAIGLVGLVSLGGAFLGCRGFAARRRR